MSDFIDELQNYRSNLLELQQKMQSEFDKAVMSLSGGALGLSFAFLKDIVKTTPLKDTSCLIAAWISWALSISCILFSFMSSAAALGHAIKQTDQKVIYLETQGGAFNTATKYLNIAGGIFFLLGVIAISFFMKVNMP